ncbi:PPE domain-containing protein [Mycobacterium heidelbergense]|uniref:PPE domain-containing protein n=1 Tax=Mycobacterium heidelbergense TaxID=53376 RepID=UPI003CF8152F
MGFTNVVWESRSTAQLARDLTEGPGPASVGGAGAAWVRVANEFAAVAADYDKLVDKLQTGWKSATSDAAMRKLEGFRKWLQDMSLAAATNGQRAEEAAVANTEAVLAMPSVSEAVAAKDAQDMMASLAAYNGAILNGNFAEFDEAARTHHANAATVMRQYEEAVSALAQPWDQPVADAATKGASAAGTDAAADAGQGGAGAASLPATPPPMPLSAWTAPDVKSGADAKAVQRIAFARGQAGGGVGGVGGMGAGGYAPMGAYGRGDDSREYESTRPAGTLEGGGEQGAGLSDVTQSWLPTTHHDSQFSVSSVSWGPNSAIFDELATPPEPEPAAFAEEPARTLEQVSDGWVSPPVIGADAEARR